MDYSNKESFTCYFCNKVIQNESKVGHTSLCSKVLISCPYKCGAYVQRANLAKHMTECVNQLKRSTTNNNLSSQSHVNNTFSLDRNGTSGKLQLKQELSILHQKFSALEAKLAKSKQEKHPPNSSQGLEEIKTTLKQNVLSIQKLNYYNGFISEWKKNMDNQVTDLRAALSATENLNKESGKRWNYIQEKMIHLQNVQIDLNLLKETIYKDHSHFKNSEMDFARNIEELRNVMKDQTASLSDMCNDQARALDNIINNIENARQIIDEQKAKQTGLVFDLRAVSQISSEAAERVEIQEREFTVMRQEVNQIKVDMEILESLACSSESDAGSYNRILWRITGFESKMKRAKENDIVLKSQIFYTHQYGYKLRVLLYLNGLKKWKDRYALACIHVLKGEYDLLLNWPCTIEGTITLRDLENRSKAKNFSKYIRTKKSCGDEEEEEPQESSSTYIFIPHTMLLKENHLKNDTIFIDVNIHDRHETDL